MTGTVTVAEGEFAGWLTFPGEPFEHGLVGPFHLRREEDGWACAFRAERRHMNAGGAVHGGCLMAFADFALFGIAHDELDGGYGVTVDFAASFLAPAREGALIEARGEVLGGGRSLVFVRGLMTTDGEACLSFSGTIRRVRG